MEIRDCLLLWAENNAWANHRLHGAVGELSHADYRKKRTGFFPSLHQTLIHVLLVDLYYVDGMTVGGRGLDVFADEDAYGSFAILRAEQRSSDKRLVELVRTSQDFAQTIALQRRDGVQTESLGTVLLHLFQHQIHHRGQAHAMLAGTVIKPPQLDEFFMADELPLREVELRDLGLRVR